MRIFSDMTFSKIGHKNRNLAPLELGKKLVDEDVSLNPTRMSVFLLVIVKFRPFATKSAKISLKKSHNFGQNRVFVRF